MRDLPGDGPEDDDERELALLAEIDDATDAAHGARAELGGLQGGEYLRALPAAVPGSGPAAALLARLLEAVAADARWRLLVLRPPLPHTAPGAVLQVELATDPSLGEPPADALSALVRGAGEVVDLLVRRAGPARCIVTAELSGGLRLRVTAVAAARPVSVDGVLLHAAEHDHHAAAPAVAAGTGVDTGRVDPARARAWLFEGWWALGDVAAAIGASSFLEAGEALAEVRRAVCRLWAIGEGVADPAAGLPVLLRMPAARLPKGLELLMPRPLPADLRTAALAAADLLHDAANHAGRRLGQVPRTGLEQAVRSRLSARR